jgi:hypothetical protein
MCWKAVLGLLLWVATAGAEGNDFRFSILGDRTGAAEPGIYERIWKEVDQLHPAFVINVGDSIEGHSDPRAASAWRDLRRVWERYRYPLFLTAGNHDVWNEMSRNLFEKVVGRPTSYGFDWGSAHFTVLDNSQGMFMPPGQLEFLEKDLKAHSRQSPKFVFFHEPFWLVPLALGSGEFPLHRLAKEYGVGYVICGHVHELIPMERDGVIYLVVGSSGGSIARGLNLGQGRSDGWFYQHVLVTVKGAAAELSVKELDGPWSPIAVPARTTAVWPSSARVPAASRPGRSPGR